MERMSMRISPRYVLVTIFLIKQNEFQAHDPTASRSVRRSGTSARTASTFAQVDGTRTILVKVQNYRVS